MSSGSKSSRPSVLPADLDRVAEADLLERLVPLEDALLDVGAILVRHGVLDPPDDLLLGRRELGFLGSDFSSRQRLICRTKVVSGFVLAEVLDGAEEVADAVVGQAGLVAAVGQLHQAVVDDERDPAAVDHGVAGGGHRAAHPPPR